MPLWQMQYFNFIYLIRLEKGFKMPFVNPWKNYDCLEINLLKMAGSSVVLLFWGCFWRPAKNCIGLTFLA